jgi:hypothetical protein
MLGSCSAAHRWKFLPTFTHACKPSGSLLALFRAPDRMHLAPEQIPQRLIPQLFELDADYVEALRGPDQPPYKLNLQAMLRDTLAALEQLPAACSHFRKTLPSQVQPTPVPTRINNPGKPEPHGGVQRGPPVGTPKTVKHPVKRGGFSWRILRLDVTPVDR